MMEGDVGNCMWVLGFSGRPDRFEGFIGCIGNSQELDYLLRVGSEVFTSMGPTYVTSVECPAPPVRKKSRVDFGFPAVSTHLPV